MLDKAGKKIQLYYREKGKGMPLILLHGNGENGNYFEHQIAYFSQKYRVIAVDTRGHGRSPRGTAPFTISQFADDLNDFLEEQKIEQAVVLGFSDGANIAMRFAMKYQEKLKALILNGGNLNAGGVKKAVQIPIELGYWTARLFSGLSKKAEKKSELLGLMVHDPNIRPSELSVIRVPVLVIAGTRDMIKEEETRRIAGSIAGARLQFIEGDHFIAARAYEKFNEAVEQFLDGTMAGAAGGHAGEDSHGA